MRVITAVEQFQDDAKAVKCFLAGGITNCPDWQSQVIENLKAYDAKFPGELDDLVIFNPRRANFPIDDPNASKEQIMWEFNWLEKMDIFSMFFTGGDSDQPICMYELGRNIYRMQMMFRTTFHKRIVISCDPTYRRANDVKIQTALAWTSPFWNTLEAKTMYGEPHIIDKADPLEHMYYIIRAYNFVKSLKTKK